MLNTLGFLRIANSPPHFKVGSDVYRDRKNIIISGRLVVVGTVAF